MSSENIKVAVRVRPLLPRERDKNLPQQWAVESNTIVQTNERGQSCGEQFTFDHIFDWDKANVDIYRDVVGSFVDLSLNGLNSTIFAYGQTSSGKTYTMLGNDHDPGIMSLAIDAIFSFISTSVRDFLLRVSYLEIYNEKINDLLDPCVKDIRIRENFLGALGLQNIKEKFVSSKEEVCECLKTGMRNRRIGKTNVNERSSRSHTIFRIAIESSDVKGDVRISTLNLVDLAGSERVAQTKATGERLKEGGHINKSLSALGLVIRQLSDGQEFVNFRDSKLTRLLQDSLGGNSKTLIIATVTLASVEDTNSTLSFAQRAKFVKNKPMINRVDAGVRHADLVQQLQRKLDEQLNVNQKLRVTQGENDQEIVRLRSQMQLLDTFRRDETESEGESAARRRHTICFTKRRTPLAEYGPSFGAEPEEWRQSKRFKDGLEDLNDFSTVSSQRDDEVFADTADANDKVEELQDLLRNLQERLKLQEESGEELKRSFEKREHDLEEKIAELEEDKLMMQNQIGEFVSFQAEAKEQLTHLGDLLKEEEQCENDSNELVGKYSEKIATLEQQIQVNAELHGKQLLEKEQEIFEWKANCDVVRQEMEKLRTRCTKFPRADLKCLKQTIVDYRRKKDEYTTKLDAFVEVEGKKMADVEHGGSLAENESLKKQLYDRNVVLREIGQQYLCEQDLLLSRVQAEDAEHLRTAVEDLKNNSEVLKRGLLGDAELHNFLISSGEVLAQCRNLERSFLQSQIDRLTTVSKKSDSSCEGCTSWRSKFARLQKAAIAREKTLAVLRSKNEKLQEYNAEKTLQISKLLQENERKVGMRSFETNCAAIQCNLVGSEGICGSREGEGLQPRNQRL